MRFSTMLRKAIMLLLVLMLFALKCRVECCKTSDEHEKQSPNCAS
jgi:hypothetical protein